MQQSIFDVAQDIFQISDVDEKMACSLDALSQWKNGQLDYQCQLQDTSDSHDFTCGLGNPGRPVLPEIVEATKVKKRKFGSAKGRACLLHALTHIELTAINLAWDTIYHYRDMPQEFYNDWVHAAAEEVRHFQDLRQHMRNSGFDYGDFPAHDELWKMGISTGHSLIHRMGVVHRVFEARALDVVPISIKKLENVGDHDAAQTLTTIANDEVGHVLAGTRWFHYGCQHAGLDADQTFFTLIRHYMKKPLAGPFNKDIRLQAGFSADEIEHLIAQDY